VGKELAYTEDEIISAIKESAGIISTISDRLNCSWGSARSYIQKYESTKQAYADEEERTLDLAESRMLTHIEQGDRDMIKYLLSRKGRKRGYSEKTEVEHTGGVKIVYLDKDDECL
jgi:hypothetical protein